MGVKRIEWVDVSKVLVIWLMVLGHILEKSGMDAIVRNMIYSFHMPFFFFISGFLYKNKTNNFWQFTIANAKSILIPYAFLRLLSFALLIPYIAITKYDLSSFVYDFFTGSAAFPAGATWYLVCFFCVKEMYYGIARQKVSLKWLLVIIMAFGSYFIPFRLFWNLDGAFMAMIFFMVGSSYKETINKVMSMSYSMKKIIFILLLSLFFIVIFSDFQGFVTLYEATFGECPLLFYPCAFGGICVVLLFCKALKSNPFVETYSSGTIVILGLHGAIYPYIILVHRVLVRPSLSDPLNFLCEIIFSIIIMLLLYYPILWLQKYMPFFIGNRR